MARLDLKPFQSDALGALDEFCRGVRSAAGRGAPRPAHDAYWQATKKDFIEVPQLAGVPYVCVRVPTGGGKTLMAAHAVGRVSAGLGRDDAPLCLWVTPGDVIRDQTLRGLRDRDHPYHDALRQSLGTDGFDVVTLEEALGTGRVLRPENATVVVTNIQSYRIAADGVDPDADPVARRIYRANGALMDANPVFGADPRVEPSLANAVKLRQPIVIIDEAHNARTRLSFDSLRRFGPSFVLELTATPLLASDPDAGKYASNVLYAVSAVHMAQPGQRMIKMPIELQTRSTWEDVLAETRRKREELAEIAAAYGAATGRRIRPVALIQAQPQSRNRETVTADRVKAALVAMGVEERRVRIWTGTTDEVAGEDPRSPASVIEFIVTVDKLREGWDCPTAYVLGSVGNVATPTAVEQLMGRVLRMPDAAETGVPELDRAYAVVLSGDVYEVARELERGLVSQCGFDERAASDALRAVPRPGLTLFPDGFRLTGPVDRASLPAEVRDRVVVGDDGRVRLTGTLTQPQMVRLRDAVSTPADRAAVEAHWNQFRPVGTAAKALDQYARPMRMPQLAVSSGDRRTLFEPVELDEYQWDLAGCDAGLTEAEFSTDLRQGDQVTVGLTTAGGVVIGDKQEVRVSRLPYAEQPWRRESLVRWLNADLHRGERFRGLTQSETLAWLLRAVDHLTAVRGADLNVLGRKRHALADAVGDRLADHGVKQLRELAAMLIDGRIERQLRTDDEFAVELREDAYAPGQLYTGAYANGLRKHAFTQIGNLNGEEAECAKRIDSQPSVARWLRNPSYASSGGFSLPLSPGRFFPDFLLEFVDGRVGIVEYKSARGDRDPEEQRKRTIGRLWADRSEGRCVFAWVVESNWDELAVTLR